jgi:hypothetical protein
VIDHKTILQQIPAKEKALTPPSLVFQARIHPVERSPIMLRPRKSQKARSSRGSIDTKVYNDSQSPTSSSDESLDIETPSKLRTRRVKSKPKQSYTLNTSQGEESNVQHWSYCTQACLLGLVRRLPLDEACPNVSAHRSFGDGSHHTFN